VIKSDQAFRQEPRARQKVKLMGHFIYTLSLATGISAGMAVIDRQGWRERAYRGLYLLGSFLLAIFGVSWAMYLINP